MLHYAQSVEESELVLIVFPPASQSFGTSPSDFLSFAGIVTAILVMHDNLVRPI